MARELFEEIELTDSSVGSLANTLQHLATAYGTECTIELSCIHRRYAKKVQVYSERLTDGCEAFTILIMGDM